MYAGEMNTSETENPLAFVESQHANPSINQVSNSCKATTDMTDSSVVFSIKPSPVITKNDSHLQQSIPRAEHVGTVLEDALSDTSAISSSLSKDVELELVNMKKNTKTLVETM